MQWISVREKLPESPENGCIIVIVASYSIERKKFHIMPAEFQRNNFYDRYSERMPIDDPYWPITHWMHLPQPPTK
jgi:hypothetical protein